MTYPDLSVLVSVYNIEAFLPACLASLEGADFSYEIILANDGSTDGSAELARRFCAQRKNAFLIEQPNGGLSAARNAALKAARGLYVWFVDGDDFVDLRQAALVLKEAVERRLDIAAALRVDVYEGGREEAMYGWLSQTEGALSGGALLAWLLRRRSYCSGVWGYLWRRRFLLEKGLAFMPGLLHEDMEFVFKAFLLARRSAFLPYAMYYYRRQRSGSITSGALNRARYVSMTIVLFELRRALRRSPFAGDADLQSHIAAAAFGVLHSLFALESLNADAAAAWQADFSKRGGFIYIFMYSKRFRYRVAACLLRVFGVKGYKRIFLFLKNVNSIAIKAHCR